MEEKKKKKLPQTGQQLFALYAISVIVIDINYDIITIIVIAYENISHCIFASPVG